MNKLEPLPHATVSARRTAGVALLARSMDRETGVHEWLAAGAHVAAVLYRVAELYEQSCP